MDPLRRSAEAMCHALETYTFGMYLTQREARQLIEDYRATVELPPERDDLPDSIA